MIFSGVTQQQYREAVKNDEDIPFKCQRCEYRPDVDNYVDQHGASFHIQTSLFSETSEMETTNRVNTSEISTTEPTLDASVNGDLIRPFNIHDRSIHAAPEPTETPLPDEELSTSLISAPEGVTYTVFPEGSKKGKPLLVSSDGFRYSIKKHNNRSNSVTWICSSRSTKISCYASVVQKGAEFKKMKDHHHAPDISLQEKVTANQNTKKKARANPFMSATAIGQEVRQDTIAAHQPKIPLVASLARAANRYRCKLRPAEPTDLNFDIDEQFLRSQDFLTADIVNGTSRHLVFSTQQQLEILS